jgi:hypothetical protein
MNDLRRTDALTLETRRTQLMTGFVVVEQDREIAKRFGQFQTLFGILNGKNAGLLAWFLQFARQRIAKMAKHNIETGQQPCPARNFGRPRSITYTLPRVVWVSVVSGSVSVIINVAPL